MKKNNTGKILMIFSGICNVMGQFFFKLSTPYFNIFYIFIGLTFLFIGGVTMVLALKYDELSNLHSLLGIGYVIAWFLAIFYFKENFSIIQILGCIFILIGVTRLGKNA